MYSCNISIKYSGQNHPYTETNKVTEPTGSKTGIWYCCKKKNKGKDI
jgi:hypothetical protein